MMSCLEIVSSLFSHWPHSLTAAADVRVINQTSENDQNDYNGVPGDRCAQQERAEIQRQKLKKSKQDSEIRPKIPKSGKIRRGARGLTTIISPFPVSEDDVIPRCGPRGGRRRRTRARPHTCTQAHVRRAEYNHIHVQGKEAQQR